MSQLLVGNPSIFALESGVTELAEHVGQLALGYFVIHIDGRVFGVRAPDASMLGCSFNAVCRRLQRRGEHKAPFSREPAGGLTDALVASMYDLDRPDEEEFFGFRSESFSKFVISNEILWAPDGDEAFDDSSHVLQFDEGNLVRLVAFKVSATPELTQGTVIEKWMSSEEFYDVLAKWKEQFEAELRKRSGAPPASS